MEARAPSLGAVMAAVLFALSCFGATLFVWRSFGGPTPLAPTGYRFHISFDQAATLTPNADVRISGVPVGKVIKVTPQGLRTDAEVELQRRYAPLPADARAILRSKTLLGETFVELTPGTKAFRKLPEGGKLPVRQVGETQGLDQVLSAFDERTRRSFKTFLGDLSGALDGRGEDLSDSIANAGTATDELTNVLVVLDSERDSFQRLIRDTGTVLTALGSRQSDLQGLITAGEQVFSATAARNRELTETTRALPAFLAELRATLASVERTSAVAAPTLRALRPVAPLLRPGLEESAKLAPELEGLFKGIPPVQRAAKTGLPAATRIVNATPPLLRVVYKAAREVTPVIQYFYAYRRDITASIANVAAATNATTTAADGTPLHYLRVLIPLNNEGPVGQPARQPTNRHNPYLAPGAQDDYLRGGLRAFDCRNTSNPATIPVVPPGTGAPPCLVQAPWKFQGAMRAFPHVERAAP
jgi:phospholipid/cholesterol/gamma-HCH transport system substrate-binding protein